MAEARHSSCGAEGKGIVKEATEELESNTNIFCLLPEVWETILPRLSPTDFLSIINATNYWNSEFCELKAKALLPLVIPVLINNIPLEAVLPLRTASYETKLDVDKAVEERVFSPSAYWAMSVNEGQRFWLSERTNAHRLFQAESFQSDVDMFELFTRVLTDDNPLKMRSISVNINIINDQIVLPQREIWSLLSILDIFGKYTRILRCDIEALSPNNSKILELSSLFETMPNLKALSICGNFRNQRMSESLVMRFPSMPHLELLDLEKYWFGDWAPREDGIDMLLLQNYGSQLKTLMCDGAFLDYAGFRLNDLAYKISKLRLVKVTLSCLQKLEQMDFLLEEIQFVKYQKCDAKTNESLRLGHFVRAFDKFSSSLTHLYLLVTLTRPLHNDVEDIEPHYMEPLPKLKIFTTKLRNVDTPWFWPLVQTKFPYLKELILHHSDINLVVEDSRVVSAEKGFQLLERLEKVLILCDKGQVASSYKIVMTKDRSARVVRA